MNKRPRNTYSEVVDEQGARALLKAIIAFLLRNGISKEVLLECTRSHGERQISAKEAREYRKIVRAYEDMGMVMSTWYSLPKFLDPNGRPLPLHVRHGTHSVPRLLRSSRVKISTKLAIELMQCSPSVRLDTEGKFVALKRVFVLPGFEIPRAALVIERYLETLRRNSSAQRSGTTLLLERNCHVPQMDFARISPILRDIKGRGTAFMDSIDGDIEAHRARKSKKKRVGELGVLVFAWTRPSGSRRSNPIRGTNQ
jgi:hypothetical protein